MTPTSGRIWSLWRTRRDLALDILAFAATVICAAVLRWEVLDLVWGLWTTSLSVGFATVAVVILLGQTDAKGPTGGRRVGWSLFQLVVFTIHFGAFHLFHCVVFHAHLPLIDDPGDLPNMLLVLWSGLKAYWPMVLAGLVSRSGELWRLRGTKRGAAGMLRAYAHVARMHVLIFLFGFLHTLGVPRLVVYPALALNHFPWGTFLHRWLGPGKMVQVKQERRAEQDRQEKT